jgi:hypothetical protein
VNAEQHAFAKDVIENARFLCDSYLVSMKPPVGVAVVDRRGYVCCGLGELALAAGHTVDDLIAVSDETIQRYTESLPLLASRFGFSEKECDTIACANDEPIETLGTIEAAEFVTEYDEVQERYIYDLQGARKAAVLRTLDSFVGASTLVGV